jgi:hypothetical protein
MQVAESGAMRQKRGSVKTFLRSRGRAACSRRGLGHDEIDHDRAAGRHRSEQTEESAPAERGEQQLGWRRCRHRAQRAKHDH